MKIACIMMQKNETPLLGPWLTYHADLFGLNNLYVFDNGSDDRETIATLTYFQKLGLNVQWGPPDSDYFNAKGKIVSNCIKWLDEHRKYDFYFPLDCDEFIAAYDEIEDTFSVERQSIENALNPFKSDPRMLNISFALDNIYQRRDCYRLSTLQQKIFFAAGACESLDIGFHFGVAKRSADSVKTNIGYFHFHNRGFWEQRYRSMIKLSGRLPDFQHETLLKHRDEKKPGFHLIDWIMMSERDYAEIQSANGDVHFPAFFEKLHSLGSSIRYDDDRYKVMVAHLSDQETKDSHQSSAVPSTQSRGHVDWWIDEGREHGMKGHLDTAIIQESVILLEGWASDYNGRPAVQIIIMADAEIVPTRTFQLVDRPDVTTVFPDVIQSCGFKLSALLNDIPADTKEIRVVSYDPRDRTSFIVRGHWGGGVSWPELCAGGRIEWTIPEETERGPQRTVENLRNQARALDVGQETGMSRRHYLNLIREGVRYFVPQQGAHGAILDQYTNQEIQYSTPCFAYAAALVAHEDGGPAWLFEAAARAMDWTCRSLSSRTAASGHEDFFPSPIAHAFPLLSPHVSPERVEEWATLLRSINPFTTYRHVIGGSGGPGSNWNCMALTGEFLLHKQGLRGSLDFFEQSIRKQGRLFDADFGMYAEGPMVYDAFPRAWLGDMLAQDNHTAVSDILGKTLDRGALTSLLIQSPNGELPSGGRSAQHVWADALQCVIFELAASRAVKQSDMQLAGMYKRAAHKALKAIHAWQAPSGAFWVVKNKVDPALRHGFEVYSSHSAYNLLTLTALGYAFEHADATKTIAEHTVPSEFGCYVIQLPAPFRKIVASAAATQVIVSLGRESNQTPPGLLRVHFGDRVPQIGPNDGLVAEPEYGLPDGSRANLTIGLAWKSEARWRSVADLSGVSGSMLESYSDDMQTRFKILYETQDRLVPSVLETYTLSQNLVEIDYSIDGGPNALAVRVPLLVSDGINENQVQVSKSAVALKDGDRTVTYDVKGATVILSEIMYPHRNGYVLIAEFKVQPGRDVRLRIDCRDNLRSGV